MKVRFFKWSRDELEQGAEERITLIGQDQAHMSMDHTMNNHSAASGEGR